MSQEQRVSVGELNVPVDREDKEWLEARLEEYRELLEYLHDH